MAVLLGALVAMGCADTGEAGVCAGAEILPHQSPVRLPDMTVLLDNETADTGNSHRTPYEWVLLLQSGCDEDLVISEVCIVADDHDGTGARAFAIEGPVPSTVPIGDEAAVRITYDPKTVNTVDADGDGAPDPDRVAIVVQSNAANFPTLIVPLCGRAVDADAAWPAVEHCESPVTLAPGAVDPTLCSR